MVRVVADVLHERIDRQCELPCNLEGRFKGRICVERLVSQKSMNIPATPQLWPISRDHEPWIYITCIAISNPANATPSRRLASKGSRAIPTVIEIANTSSPTANATAKAFPRATGSR
jgi:hypothetical protein